MINHAMIAETNDYYLLAKTGDSLPVVLRQFDEKPSRDVVAIIVEENLGYDAYWIVGSVDAIACVFLGPSEDAA